MFFIKTMPLAVGNFSKNSSKTRFLLNNLRQIVHQFLIFIFRFPSVNFNSPCTVHCVDNILAWNNRCGEHYAYNLIGRRSSSANDILWCYTAGQNSQSLRQGRRCLWQRLTSCFKNVHRHDLLCEWFSSLLCIQITCHEKKKTLMNSERKNFRSSSKSSFQNSSCFIVS